MVLFNWGHGKGGGKIPREGEQGVEKDYLIRDSVSSAECSGNALERKDRGMVDTDEYVLSSNVVPNVIFTVGSKLVGQALN